MSATSRPAPRRASGPFPLWRTDASIDRLSAQAGTLHPEQPDGVELLLEPSAHPAVPPYREALVADGIPAAQFAVEDVQAEYERLRGLGVTFTQEPAEMGPMTTAVFDDTCDNLIQIAAVQDTAQRG